MSLWLTTALVGLSSLAVGCLLLPLLLRRARPAAREAYNLAVYRDQLAEVERDLARGLLSSDQAEAARGEIGRRILALPAGDADLLPRPKAVAAATVAILLLPVGALALYALLGAPLLPDRPFAERSADTGAPSADAGKAPHLDMQRAAAQIRAHLKTHPDDLTGWVLLGRSELSLGHYPAAADAYRHAADLSGRRPDIAGAWGEAQVLAAGGSVTPAARAAFEAGLKDPESAPRSRYYLALAQMQQGDVSGALTAWRQLAADSPTDAAWLPVVRRRIAEAEAKLGQPAGEATPAPKPGNPSPAAVAAAEQAVAQTTPEQRQAMIDAMVARLAAHLQNEPDDVAGWARLGRSYMVLNRPDKARDAFARAVALKPGDAALVQALAEATAASGKTGAANGAK